MSGARATGKVAHSRFHALSQSSSSSSDDEDSADFAAPAITMRQRKTALRESQRAEAAAAAAATATTDQTAATSVKPSRPCVALLGRILFFAWKVVQTLVCVVTFFLGGFLCGGCCVPWRRRGSRAARVPHRRRRRRSTSQLLPGTPATPATPAIPVATPEADYESWTEDDDDIFEYQPHEPVEGGCGRRVGRRCWARGVLCRGGVLVAALLIAYVLVFVRVHPSRDGSSDSLEVQFGFNDLVPSIGVAIPEHFHAGINALMGEPRRPGLRARRDGLRAHFPIVFVPGIVSTGLEVWEGEECAKSHFRQRMWGSALMVRSILLDSRCWLRHLSLDGWTGVDPEGIKLRPAAGLEAADYLIAGYWVWAKMIENFADVGYDGNSSVHTRMFMAPYDWRLSFRHMQLRDFFFTKLKSTIEIAKLANHNRKVVLIAHSMGANVLLYFLNWVESSAGGGGGPEWVADHVESWVNIGGPMLGVPKSFSAIFSGEMRDTAEMAPLLTQVRRTGVFSQSDILNIMRTFRSLPSIFPKGGDVVWGDETGAPDDPVPGESDQPTERPIADYPGGSNESFITSQASAEKRNARRYEDARRIDEALHPETRSDADVAAAETAQNATASASPNVTGPGAAAAAASSSASEPEQHSQRTGAYQGQFLTFTRPVPWPFPNITRAVTRLVQDNGGDTSARSAKRLKQAVQDCAVTGLEPGANGTDSRHPNVTVSGLNLEDAVQLLKMVAWPDMDFNAQLYSQGYGAAEGMDGVNERQSRERFLKEQGAAGAGSGADAAGVKRAVATAVHPEPTSSNSDGSVSQLDLLDLSSPSVKNDERRWSNPLESSLPLAPSMKIFCFYGVGKDSERGYVYSRASEIPDWPSIADMLPSKAPEAERISGQKKKRKGRFGRGRRDRKAARAADAAAEAGASGDGASARSDRGSLHEGVDESEHGNDRTANTPPRHIGARSPTIALFQLNTSYHDPAARIRSGVKLSDGDGTVPLVSLGFMCVDGWKQARWNPAGLPVVTREYRDPSDSPAMLRAATSVDHVDIMGNSALISDLLYIACIRTKKPSNPNTEGTAQADEAAEAGNATAQNNATSAVPASSDPTRLAADIAAEKQQAAHDEALRLNGASEPSEQGSTEEQATWKVREREQRLAGQPLPPVDGASPADDDDPLLVLDDEEAEDEERQQQQEGDSASAPATPIAREGGHASSAESLPVGELTWTEVGERIYSRIRPISLRVRQRWERRTGHRLVEADKPPPLNKLRQARTNSGAAPVMHPAGSPDAGLRQREQAQASAAAGDANGRRFEWTEEDEAQLRRLLELRESAQPRAPLDGTGAAGSASRSAEVSASLQEQRLRRAAAELDAAELAKRTDEERVERELQARAEERSAQRQQSLRNSQRDNAADAEGKDSDTDLTLTAAATIADLT